MLVDHEELLEHWRERGLVDDELAARLDADLPEGTVSSAVAVGLETLAWLGAALVVGALFALFDVDGWGRPAQAVLAAAIAAVAGTVAARLLPTDDARTARIGTVVGLAGSAALLALPLLLLGDGDGCVAERCAWTDRAPLLLGFLAGTLGATTLYRREANGLTHAAMGLGAAMSLWAFAYTVLPEGGRATDRFGGMLLLVTALAWTWASETGRLRPAWVGTLGAGIAGTSAIFIVLDGFEGGAEDLRVVAMLLYGIGHVAAGQLLERWRLTTVGAVVLLFTAPMFLTEVLGLGDTATAAVLLAGGLGVLAWAAQRLRRPDETPTAA